MRLTLALLGCFFVNQIHAAKCVAESAGRTAALVYTPQVLLQGRDFRGWGGKGFDAALAELLAPAGDGEPALYLAAYQNRLESRVSAGENRGRTLAHDYVVLEWQGPFGLGAAGRASERRELPLLPRAAAADSGVVGFVQDRRSAEVLQALMLPACST